MGFFCLFEAVAADFDGFLSLSCGGGPLFFGNAMLTLNDGIAALDGALCAFGGGPLVFPVGLTLSIDGLDAATDAVVACGVSGILVPDDGMIAVGGLFLDPSGRPLFFSLVDRPFRSKERYLLPSRTLYVSLYLIVYLSAKWMPY